MCEILDVLEIEGKPLIPCTYEPGDFMSAKTIRIYDKNNDFTDITRFAIEKIGGCFSNKPKTPILRIDEEIENRFLQRGNRVVIT